MQMLDQKLARIRAYRNNIDRYRRLLATRLSDVEREYIERRMSEESSALETLTSETFPIELTSATSQGCHSVTGAAS